MKESLEAEVGIGPMPQFRCRAEITGEFSPYACPIVTQLFLILLVDNSFDDRIAASVVPGSFAVNLPS
jgi:hypothetical protein